jgi:periplasmic protein TonB
MTGVPPPLPRRSSSALPAIIAILLIVGVATAGLLAAFLVWQTGILDRRAPAPTAETATPPTVEPERAAPPEPPPVEAAAESTPVPEVPVPTRASRSRARAAVPATPEGGTVGNRLGGLAEAPAPPPPPMPIRVAGNIRAPAKVRNVQPEYPLIAQRARVQGVVILEARIGTTGKVEDVRVLRSIPLLDQSAIDAVRQWEYQPTLLNGVPVPVIMTVTVNFTLQR